MHVGALEKKIQCTIARIGVEEKRYGLVCYLALLGGNGLCVTRKTCEQRGKWMLRWCLLRDESANGETNIHESGRVLWSLWY
jgi:hypothetical protein